MTRVRPRWAIRIGVGLGLVVLSLAAPTVPPAAADDGMPLPASPELVVAALDDALDGAVDAALETVPELSSAGPVAPLPAIVSQEAGVPAAPPLEAAAEPEPPPQPAPAQAAATASTQEPSTTAPAARAPEPEPIPVATEVQPVNVNVTVRVDSPGDGGSVTQVNDVEVAGPTPVIDTPAEQYQPPPPQYQPTQAAVDTPPAFPEAPSSATAEPGWSWSWSCGDSTSHVLSPNAGNEILPTNWSWNWTWNCGQAGEGDRNDESKRGGQYHPVVTQYHPVNVNISIRVNSPGNDGPVTQTNVTVVVVSPPALAIPALPVSVSVPAPALAFAAAGLPAQADLVSELAPAELTMVIDAAEVSAWIFRGPTGPHGVDSAGTGQAAHAARLPLAPTASTNGGDARTSQLVPKSSAWTVRAVAVTHAEASVRPDRPARARSSRKPSRRPLPPMRTPVLASGFAGAAPGGADGGGWPLLALLLVPFSLALVDSASRTVRVATLPAGAELRSRRERPG